MKIIEAESSNSGTRSFLLYAKEEGDGEFLEALFRAALPGNHPLIDAAVLDHREGKVESMLVQLGAR
jgi:hypothetical protein